MLLGMVDPKDITDDARAKMKKHLGGMLAEQERLEALVKKDQAELARLDQEIAAIEDPGLLGQLKPLREELAARLSANQEALALVAQGFEATRADMKDLGRFGDKMQREQLVASLAVKAPGDALSSDPTDRALANVRDHIENLAGRVALDRELGAKPSAQAEGESEEARARKQLEALKAARKKGGGDDGPGGGGPSSGRTL